VTVAPEEAEGITPNHFTAFELRLAWAKGWIGVEPAGEASLTAAVGTGAEPSEWDRLVDARMTIAPIQLETLLLAEDSNGDGGSLCWFLHREILGSAGKRQMSAHERGAWGCRLDATEPVANPTNRLRKRATSLLKLAA
jgi:hypothetical protein